MRWTLDRGGVDHEAVADLAGDDALVGVVDVVADASDGRVSTLRSTERAESRMLEVRHENRAVFRSHVEGWTDDELAQFAGWLHRFNTPADPR